MSKGRSGSDAKQTWDLERVRELLGPYLAREAAVDNPYTEAQAQRESNRGNAAIAASGNRQLQDLMAKAGVNGFDPNSAAVLLGRQGVLQNIGKQQQQNSSQVFDKFRQNYGNFALKQGDQAIGQRGQDVSQRGMDQGIINALLGQTKSFGENDATSQNTSGSRNESQSTNQSTGSSQASNWGNSYGYNNGYSEWWPILSML